MQHSLVNICFAGSCILNILLFFHTCEKKDSSVDNCCIWTFKVTSHAESLKKLAVALAELDVSSSLAVLAVKRGYVKPIIGNQNEFLVKGGRHPVVDMLQPNSFVCNDCDLGKKNLWIITGPNMGGKCPFISNHFFKLATELLKKNCTSWAKFILHI